MQVQPSKAVFTRLSVSFDAHCANLVELVSLKLRIQSRLFVRGLICAVGGLALVATHAQTIVPGKIVSRFSVSPSGAATYSIPIQVPPGIAGMEPKLSLEYNSQAGSGIAGAGWNLGALSAITRCGKTKAQDGPGVISTAVTYGDDRYCLDGQRLMMVSGVSYGFAGSEYRTEIDNFSQITVVDTVNSGLAYITPPATGVDLGFGIGRGYAGESGPKSFIVKTKSGLTMEYGATDESRIEALNKTPGYSTQYIKIRTWLVNKISDAKGNYIAFGYQEDTASGEVHLWQITYGNNFGSVVSGGNVILEYEARPDVQVAYQAGVKLTSSKRLKEIRTFSYQPSATATFSSQSVSRWVFGYASYGLVPKSILTSIVSCDSANNCLAPTRFDYTNTQLASTPSSLPSCDRNGVCYQPPIRATQPADVFSPVAGNYPGGPDFGVDPGRYWQPVVGDFNGDGRDDIARLDAAGIWVLISAMDGVGTTGFTNVSGLYPASPNFGNDPDRWKILVGDFNADGKADFIRLDATGYWLFTSNGDGTFTPTANSYPAGPNFGALPNNWQIIQGDFNGDGRTDFARLDATQLWVFLGNGNGTFTPWAGNYPVNPNFGADLKLWKPIVGDFNGDGKTDFARLDATSLWVFLSNGDGTFTPAARPYPAAPNFGNDPANYWKPITGDFNGDGITDFARLDAKGLWVFISQGDSTFSPVAGLYQGAPDFGSDPKFWQILTGDFNGDGKTDFARIDATSMWLFTSLGDGTFQAMAGSYPANPNFGNTPGSWYPITGDFNGDGQTDFARLDAKQLWVFKSQPETPQIANFIQNAGDEIKLNYRYLSDTVSPYIYAKDADAVYPRSDLQMPLRVVSKVLRGNGIGGRTTTDYWYQGLKAERDSGRGLLGFRRINRTDVDKNISTMTDYYQDFPYVGMQKNAMTKENIFWPAPNAPRLKDSASTAACKQPPTGVPCVVAPGNRYMPYEATRVEQNWDLNRAVLPTITTSTEYGVNPGDTLFWGDPTKIIVSSDDGSSKTTSFQYLPANTANGKWILGRVKKTDVTSVKP
jgi:hypothetical protein